MARLKNLGLDAATVKGSSFAFVMALLLALSPITAQTPVYASDLPAGKARLPTLATCDLSIAPDDAPTNASSASGNQSSDDDSSDDDSDPGPSYIRLPNSETCIALGGELEYDLGFQRPVADLAPGYVTTVLPRIAVDTLTQTDYGLLRAFLRMSFSQPNAPANASATLEYAFVSLGRVQTGLAEAGFSDSTFSFYNNALNVITLRGPGPSATMLRYARKPDEGFGWGISLEGAPTNVRQAQLDRDYNLKLSTDTTLPQRLPIANVILQLAGDWGKAVVSGSVGQVQLQTQRGDGSLPRLAAMVGLQLNMTGPLDGDQLWLQAAVASANASYLGFGNSVQSGGAAVAVTEGVASRAGPVKPTSGAAFTAAYSHSLNDQWTLNTFGSWATLQPAIPTGSQPFVVPFKELRIGANAVFQPVDKLSLTFEAMYINLQTSVAQSLVTTYSSTSRSTNTLAVGFQAKRDF